MKMEETIARIREFAVWYRNKFGRSLGVTGELGELYACEMLALRRTEAGEKGIDAVRNGKTYQIKTRAPRKGSEVNPRGRIGKLSSSKFDYALLVILDGEYNLKEIWQAHRNDLERGKAFEDETEKTGMHVTTFRKHGTKILP